MNQSSIRRAARRRSIKKSLLMSACAMALFTTQSANAIEVEGFTEPYRTVDVAAADPGIVMSMPVRVGDRVAKGTVIAKLDEDLHTVMLGMARDRKEAIGRLQAANAEVQMRETRVDKLTEITDRGFGRKEEVQRATADLNIAQSNLQIARDELVERRWQFKKAEIELARRVIKSPLNGVVTARLKEPGEYVAPNEPNVVTIVQLDPLLAKFSMKRTLARHIRVGDEIEVTIRGVGIARSGIVDSVSPVIDAQSGTLKIKVRIDNPDGMILSGERCVIDVELKDIPAEQNKKMALRRKS